MQAALYLNTTNQASPVGFRASNTQNTAPIRYFIPATGFSGQDTLHFGLMAPGNGVINGFYDEDIAHALAFVAKNHGPQNRPGTEIPYLSHVLGVADIALRYAHPLATGSDLVEAPSAEFPKGITRKDIFIAALLHDVIEDQGGDEMEARVREKFGDTVTHLVVYCSDLKDQLPAGTSYKERKRQYLTRIAAGPASAMLISGADKLHNLQAGVSEYLKEGEGYWRKFNGHREEKLQYYRDVIDIFGASGKQPDLVAMIDLTYNQLLQMVAKHEAPPQTITGLMQKALKNFIKAAHLFLQEIHTAIKTTLNPATPPSQASSASV